MKNLLAADRDNGISVEISGLDISIRCDTQDAYDTVIERLMGVSGNVDEVDFTIYDW